MMRGSHRETKWIIINPGLHINDMKMYGNAGNWYKNINDAEEFLSIEDAWAHLDEYGDNAVVGFIESNTPFTTT